MRPSSIPKIKEGEKNMNNEIKEHLYEFIDMCIRQLSFMVKAMNIIKLYLV